jgi:hypothetical protein
LKNRVGGKITGPFPWRRASGYDGGMAEAQKRFPWRLLAGAVVLVPLAAVIGLIEAVGRQGTLAGRGERLEEGMSLQEVRSALGIDFDTSHQGGHRESDGWVETKEWSEGPAHVITVFRVPEVPGRFLSRLGSGNDWKLRSSEVHIDGSASWLWHVRRWAEQAYTAIHGPRR